MNILQAIDDPHLFAPWFKNAATWAAWRAFLAALFALPMTDAQIATYQQCTGRAVAPAPGDAAQEAWIVCGRRAGKSFVLALVAVFLACFRSYQEYLAPGERATILVIAADRRQARTIMRYIRAMLTRIPMLKRLIERETAESFDLSNSVSIEVGTASWRAARGQTLAAALCDELAFWMSDDSKNPDYEILDAIRPGGSTIPSFMLLCASSPYAKRGALHDAHKRYFGKDGPVLVWQAATRTMNPSVPQRVIDEAMARDPNAASSEYLAQFRNDISGFVPREIVQACVVSGEREVPRKDGIRYSAFTDPSGGSADSFTLAIGHSDKDAIILDALREIPAPFDPESAVEEYVKVLRSYGVSEVVGDRYAGQWVAQSFQKRGIKYTPSEMPKSALYVDLLPKLNAKTIRLLDNDRLINQLTGLERRTARGGKDSIDHSPGAKDDVANVVAGLAAHVTSRHVTTIQPLVI